MERIGKYIILEEIGRGGMGCVYKARDPVIERDVAIKVILERVLDVPEIRQRFYREARSAGRLAHDNIVVVHDVGEEDGLPYIVMEFLEGRDLREAMNAGPMHVDERLEIALWICKGLKYAHEHGVIHRDVKPENVRLLEGNRVKIVDFGIARLDTGTQTLTHASIGTPRYMSPEQIKGAAVDHRTDIFSFGVVFHELLTGSSPFQGDHVTTLVYKILNEEPPPLNLEDPRLFDQLQPIVSTCLEKDVDRRYPDFGAVIKALQNVIRKRQATRTMPALATGSEEDLDRTVTGPARRRPFGVPSAPGREGKPDEDGPSRRVVRIAVGVVLLLSAVALTVALIRWQDASVDSRMLAQSTTTAAESAAAAREGAGEFRIRPGEEVREGQSEDESAPGRESPSGEPERLPPADHVEDVESGRPSVADDEAQRDETLRLLAETADAAQREMEAARQQVEGPHEDGDIRSAFSEIESLRQDGLEQYAANAYADAVESFQQATAGYVEIGNMIAESLAEGEGRTRADEARSEMLSVKEAIPASVQQTRPYLRALDFETEGDEAFERGEYDRAYDRYLLAQGSFAEAGAPEFIVQAEARAIQERLKHAIIQEDWSAVPAIVTDGYRQQVRDIRRYWRITDVTISDQSANVDQNGATATLPVTVTIHYVQPGGFDPGNYSLFYDWTWKENAGVLQLAQVELIRTSR